MSRVLKVLDEILYKYEGIPFQGYDDGGRVSFKLGGNEIIAAYNNAKENLKKKSAEELSKVTGGLNLPADFKLPF